MMGKIKYYLPLFGFLFIGKFVFGQQDLTLAQAIEIGLKNNFQIQIAEKNVEIGENYACFAPVVGPPFVRDLDGGRRDGTAAPRRRRPGEGHPGRRLQRRGGRGEARGRS